jgi:FkbM family methyltransferase
MKPAPIDPPEIQTQLWEGIGGSVGWDIGANCGQSLPQMTHRFHTTYAFEPAQECANHLAAWTRSTPRRVIVLPIAISDLDDTIDLAALPDKIDTGQLVTPGTHGMEWTPDVPTAVARSVPARTIDSLTEELLPPDFLKIDVEGHELHVLTGAWQTLTDYRPDLLIEFHTPQLYRDCIECLEHHGYTQITTVRHPHYPPQSQMWHQHGWIRASYD